jgi:hypothetical protein
MHGLISKIPSKNFVHIYIYIHDVKFLALLGAPYVYDISRLRVSSEDWCCKDIIVRPKEYVEIKVIPGSAMGILGELCVFRPS